MSLSRGHIIGDGNRAIDAGLRFSGHIRYPGGLGETRNKVIV